MNRHLYAAQDPPKLLPSEIINTSEITSKTLGYRIILTNFRILLEYNPKQFQDTNNQNRQVLPNQSRQNQSANNQFLNDSLSHPENFTISIPLTEILILNSSSGFNFENSEKFVLRRKYSTPIVCYFDTIQKAQIWSKRVRDAAEKAFLKSSFKDTFAYISCRNRHFLEGGNNNVNTNNSMSNSVRQSSPSYMSLSPKNNRRMSVQHFGHTDLSSELTQQKIHMSTVEDDNVLISKETLPSKSSTKPFDVEYHRLNWLHFQNRWRIVKNENYSLVPTYGEKFLIPYQINDGQIHSIIKFRHLGRFPVPTWKIPNKNVVMLRSSQPSTGILGMTRNRHDEALFHYVSEFTNNKTAIIDCRSNLAAGGNRFKGGGTEHLEYYTSCSNVKFLNLPNIHSVRESLQKMLNLFESVYFPTEENYLDIVGSPSNLYLYENPNNNQIKKQDMGQNEGNQRNGNSLSPVSMMTGASGLLDQMQKMGNNLMKNAAKDLSNNQPNFKQIASDQMNFQHHSENNNNKNDKIPIPSSSGMPAFSYVNETLPTMGSFEEIPQNLLDMNLNQQNKQQATTNYISLGSNSENFYSELEKSQWLNYISNLLTAALQVQHTMIISNQSCLIHCSDGWDRTSQLCALTKLISDPFYRTLTGFKILIETDFIYYGHKLADRNGVFGGIKDENERSPIFLQFLDCVFQIICQFPNELEFNENFIIKLAKHSISGLVGNFFFNTDCERKEYHVDSRTRSIWDILGIGEKNAETVRNEKYSVYKNVHYQPKLKLLTPIPHLSRLKIWSNMYLDFTPQLSTLCRIYLSKKGMTGSGRGQIQPEMLSFDAESTNNCNENDNLENLENSVANGMKHSIDMTNTSKVNLDSLENSAESDDEFVEDQVPYRSTNDYIPYNNQMNAGNMLQEEVIVDVHQPNKEKVNSSKILEPTKIPNVTNVTKIKPNSPINHLQSFEIQPVQNQYIDKNIEFLQEQEISTNQPIKSNSNQNQRTRNNDSHSSFVDEDEMVNKLLTEQLLNDATQDIPGQATTKTDDCIKRHGIDILLDGRFSDDHSQNTGGRQNFFTKDEREDYQKSNLKKRYCQSLMAEDLMEMPFDEEYFEIWVNKIRNDLLDRILGSGAINI